jgi:thioesterase domain-containing protein
LVAELRELAAKQGCSFFALTLGALSILMARVSRQPRFVLALPTAEQPVLGQPELVGHCVALLPFLVDLREEESIRDFLSRVQRDLGAAHDHSACTLVSLFDNLRQVHNVQGVSPVSAGLTSFKKFQPHELPQSGFSADYTANAKAFDSFEWYLSAIEAGDVLVLHCHYDTGLFGEETVNEWLTGFAGILQDIVADPSRGALQLARIYSADAIPAATSREAIYSLPSTMGETRPVFPRNFSLETIPPSANAAAVILFDGKEPLLDPLQDLFRKVLNRSSVLPDDDFFSLGGHSMMAAQLFARLERELGLTAPLSVLYEASTPRQLAGKLSGGRLQRQWKSLVPIHPDGNRPPLFLVHGGGGNVLMFRDLGILMSPDYPLYALQSQGLDGSGKYLRSIEEMAKKYLQEVREVQPNGPYHLGGFCMGAHVAFEMAQRLSQSGQQVDLLVSIDSYNFNGPRPKSNVLDAVRYQVQRFQFHFSNLLHLGLRGQISFFKDKFKIARERETERFRVKMNELKGRNPGGGREEFIEDINDRAMFAYVPRDYPGKMTIIKPQRNYSYLRDPWNGWKEVVGGDLDVIVLPVDPGGIFIKPYVQSLADHLKEKIDSTVARRKESLAAEVDSSRPFNELSDSPLGEMEKIAPDFLKK